MMRLKGAKLLQHKITIQDVQCSNTKFLKCRPFVLLLPRYHLEIKIYLELLKKIKDDIKRFLKNGYLKIKIMKSPKLEKHDQAQLLLL